MLCQLLQYCGLRKKWPSLTREEVSRHNTRESLWIVAGNSVYDVTRLLGIHPGGDGALLKRGGGVTDCQRDFDFHSYATRRRMPQLKIGELAQDTSPCAASSQPCGAPATTVVVTVSSPCGVRRCGGELVEADCMQDGSHRNSNSQIMAEQPDEAAEMECVVQSNLTMVCRELPATSAANGSKAKDKHDILPSLLASGRALQASSDRCAACTASHGG